MPDQCGAHRRQGRQSQSPPSNHVRQSDARLGEILVSRAVRPATRGEPVHDEPRIRDASLHSSRVIRHSSGTSSRPPQSESSQRSTNVPSGNSATMAWASFEHNEMALVSEECPGRISFNRVRSVSTSSDSMKITTRESVSFTIEGRSSRASPICVNPMLNARNVKTTNSARPNSANRATAKTRRLEVTGHRIKSQWGPVMVRRPQLRGRDSSRDPFEMSAMLEETLHASMLSSPGSVGRPPASQGTAQRARRLSLR